MYETYSGNPSIFVRYKILFQRAMKTAWHAKITEATEAATTGIEAWLTSFGWDFEVIDLRSN